MCRCEGYGFQAVTVYSSIGYNCKSKHFGLELAIIFHETDQLVD